MARKAQKEVLKELQNNPEVVVLNNVFAVPRLTRPEKRGKDVLVQDDYSRKVFYKIVSMLNPSHFEMAEHGKTVVLQIGIKDFLHEIGAEGSHNLYRYVIDCVNMLQGTQVKWEDTKYSYGVSVISYYKHDKGSGKIDLHIHPELIKLITPVTEWEHFSFYLKHILRLQSKQAGNLFSYLVSWRNRGMVDIQLDAFKRKFGYDTAGYAKFSNLKSKVLDPAMTEINEKTDLLVSYEAKGDGNQNSKKPRVSGLRFFIAEKSKQKRLKESATGGGLFDQTTATTPPQPPAKKKVIEEQEANPIFEEFAEKVAERFGIGAEAFRQAIEGKTKEDVLQALEAVEERRQKGGLKSSGGLFLKALKEGYKSAEQTKKEARETKQKRTAEQVEQLRQLDERREEIKARRREAINGVIGGMRAINPNIAEEVKEKADKRNALLQKFTVEDLRKSENKKWREMFIEQFVIEYPEAFKSVTEAQDQELEKIETEIKKIKQEQG